MASKKRALILSSISTILCILLYFLVPFEGLEMQGKGCLIIFIWAVLMWIFRPIPEYLVSMLSVALVVIIFGVSGSSALVGFSNTGWWMVFLATFLGASMEKTGIARRAALWFVSKWGNTYLKALYSTNIANTVVSSFMSSGTGRSALMSSVTDGICDAMGFQAGKTKDDTALMISNCFTAATHSGFFYTATGAAIIGMGFVTEFTGKDITWGRWLAIACIPVGVVLILIPIMSYFMFKPKDGNIKIDNSFAKKELAALGPMTRDEKVSAIIFVATIAFWATQKIHGISADIVIFLSVFALLCPGIGVCSLDEVKNKIPWAACIWLGFAMSLATVVSNTGGLNWLVNMVFIDSGLTTGMSFSGFMLIWIPVTVLLHIIFSGINAMCTIFVPISLLVADALGFDPYTVGVVTTLCCVAGETILPFNSSTNMIYLNTGRFTVAQEAKGGLVVDIMLIIMYIVCLYTYWPLIGLL